MKKTICILSCLLMYWSVVLGQTYTPMSYDDYAAPLREYQQAFNRASNQIQSVENMIMNALANDIDEELRYQLNSDYSRLSSISEKLNRNGLYAQVWNEISNVRSSVNNHINSYNNRVAQERKRQAELLEQQRRAEAEKQRQQAIREEEQRKAGWSGTGFALNQGHIVTNYHVVEDAKTILVKGIKGDFNTEYRAKVAATDKANDIAIIKIDDERFKGFGSIPYKIKRAMSDVGESVWALGYPMIGMMGEEIKFTDGKISARTGLQGDVSTYQISVPIQPGNSGGPLFDNYGNIVGITSSGLNKLYSEQTIQTENVNYAIKTSYLYNVVESSLPASIIPQGTAMQGQSLTQRIKLAQNYVFLLLCSDDPNFHADKIPNVKLETLPANDTEKKIESIPNVGRSRDTLTNGDIVITNPIGINQSDITITKVTITRFNTILDFRWFNKKYYEGWCNINRDAYLRDSSGKTYRLVQAENISYSPDRDDVPYHSVKTFRLYFEKISSSVEKFDFIEGSSSKWKIYDINIK